MTDRDIGALDLDEFIDDLAGDETAEPDEAEDVSLEVQSDLPIDRGLEVIINPTPGDLWRESHAHNISDEAFILHLTPGDAQEFDRYLIQYIMENL